MAKFVMGSQQPQEFRKCKLDYEQSEFNEGKKKNFFITLNSIQLNPDEHLYQQSYYQGKSSLNCTGKSLEKTKNAKKQIVDIDSMTQSNAQGKTTHNNLFNLKEKYGMSKYQLKQFQKQCVALKVGIAKNREYGIVVPYEKSPVRQITSTKPNNDKKPAKLKLEFKTLEIESDTEEDANMDFFSYLQDLTVRPQTAKVPSGPQFRGKRQYFFESDRLDRSEYDSRISLIKRDQPEKTLKEKYEERKKEKINNSIPMNQHPCGHVKTDAGEKYMKYLAEYQKNKPNFKKVTIVKRGNKGQMSSMYPPMFERARLTKKLYYRTSYKTQYQPPQFACFKQGGSKFGTAEFRKTYRPILYNS